MFSRSKLNRFWPFLFWLVASTAGFPVYADEVPVNENTESILKKLFAQLNGDIFWAPASGFTTQGSWPNAFGDEIRSVFGPIPPVVCVSDVGLQLTIESRGNRVNLTNADNGEHTFEHRSVADKIDKVSKIIKVCDKPSLANTDGHLCGASSRIAILEGHLSNNVDWVVLCRKSERSWRLTSWDSYWHQDNPHFALLGIIGFNANSGEVVFIDGNDRKPGGDRLKPFTWTNPYPPPGGMGYEDNQSRAETHGLYSYAKQISCETCHDNKEPWIITPHLKIRGFGYRDRTREEKFGSSNVLPLAQPRAENSPYRVIGTRYTKKARLASKTFKDPTGSCTFCHTLTTGWTGQVLAYDAVGKVNPNEPYKSVFKKINDSRTDWAKQEQNTHSWMVPWLGPNVKPNPETGWIPTEIDEKNWDRIAACINETSTEDCEYKNVYTSCPSPESLEVDCSKDDELNSNCSRLADPFGPSEMSFLAMPIDEEIEETGSYNRKAVVNWTYLNGLGGVPQRDDVRFNLAVKEVDIPIDASSPKNDDYPSRQAAADPYFAQPDKKGDIHYCDLDMQREKTCHIINPDQGEFFINNISYAGHIRNTTPEPALKPRQYSVVIPTQCNKRYLARLVPKRFCFDRSGVLASNVDHVKYFDVHCKAE
jgi:hypothetical protein